MSIKTVTVSHRVCDFCEKEIAEHEGFHFEERLSDGCRIEIHHRLGEGAGGASGGVEYLSIDQRDFCGVECSKQWWARMLRALL